MATDDTGDKTEDPTEHRRSEARQKGNVARSTDLNAAVSMLAASAALFFFGAAVSESMAQLMRFHLEAPHWLQLDQATITAYASELTQVLASTLLPFMMLMFAAVAASNVVQVGFLISGDVLQPKINRLSPLSGFKRIFSVKSLVKLAVSLAKLTLLVSIAGWWIYSQAPGFIGWGWGVPTNRDLGSLQTSLIATGIGQSVVNLALLLSLALILLALLDFAFQKWKHEQELKMSKQEIRDEMKQMEGDPLTRQRRREAHRKMVEARELQQVQDADVVITNPTHIAVALKYDAETMLAPQVVAKGMGEIAARIRQIAIEHDIPIIERKPLARALYRDVKTGQTIPVEMYEVFVEIMAYVYRLEGRKPPSLV